MDQTQAFKILKSGKNIFLTGSAGTGKTFLLNKFINYLKEKKITVGVTASTGIAATHLDGRTIHSWVGMGISTNMNEEIRRLIKKDEIRTRIREAKVLIVDEISMLGNKRLDLVDEICRFVKGSFLPFGGMQVILSGDFFQLPPVSEKDGLTFAYKSYIWQDCNLKICYLEKAFRQEDKEFINILNQIRENRDSQKVLNILKKRLYKPINNIRKPTKLYTHNTDVNAINDYELARLKGKEMSYYMTERGPKDLIKTLKKGCLAPEELKLKIGALVIFIKNNFDVGYVNGTLGKVVGFNEDNYPIIETRKGQKIILTQSSWTIEENDEIIARISQVPLRLAWAITVHKSQGMSLDVAEIDLSKSFECGMGYVALSRVRKLSGIRLMGINKMALRVNEEIIEKDKEFKSLSKKLEN